MKIIMAGSAEPFVDNVKYLIKHGFVPELLVLSKEKDNRSLRKALAKYNIPFCETDYMHSIKNRITSLKPDLLVCVGYPEILKKTIIGIPKKGVVNLHTSKLPEYRGRHPVPWALINCEKEIGVTLHFINTKIDEGEIILQDVVSVEREDDYNSVILKLIDRGKRILLAGLKQIESGSVYRKKQPIVSNCYWPRRTPADSQIDWSKNGSEIHGFVNALVKPMPNAFAYINSRKVFFKRSYRGEKVGEVIDKTVNGLWVVAVKDGVVLVELEKKPKIGDIIS